MMKASRTSAAKIGGGTATRSCSDLLKAQFGLRMQIATQQLTNTSQLARCAATSRACGPS